MISLQTMQGRVGLGERPMKVSIAYVKGKDGSISYPSTQPEDLPETANANPSQGQDGQQGQTGDYAAQWEQYNQYWQQYAAWQQYYAQNQGAKPPDAQAAEASVAGVENSVKVAKDAVEEKGSRKQSMFEGNLKELVKISVTENSEVLNQEFLEQSEELYTAIDDSRWWYK
eukprot:GFUD01101810.1.p1 GENE.GFUD01101810.1~~GFUD01101810.1.p1  ORF type:complete len:171 (-),score=51.90 GFUD01101810.1:2-514(-)